MSTAGTGPADLTIVPANEATWADLAAIFGPSGTSGRCNCQGLKTHGRQWGQATEWAVQVYAEAGFTEVSSPSVRRAVMRVDFDAQKTT
jgi:hypothetical protein